VKNFQEQLKRLEDKNRLRSLSLPAGIDLTSNDYLGFADHDFLRHAASEAVASDMLIGAAASRLLRGHLDQHQSLERYAADFFGSESALFFATGFQANYALLTCLPDRHDVIIFDELIHASTRDGIRASDAKSVRVRHNDMDAYEAALSNARENCTGQIWVAVESLYSMDGDYPDLGALYALAERYDAMLVIDEAHGVGVFGRGGKGMAEDLIAAKGYERIITVYTCGKALGVAGGLICARRDICDFMVNRSRAFIYSTAPMPLQAHLVQKALELLASDEGLTRLQLLRDISAYMKDKIAQSRVPLETMGWEHQAITTQILPIILGTDEAAVATANALQAKGFDVRAIRPPSVPEGTSRLRISLSANLTTEIIDDFMTALEAAIPQKKEAA